MGIRLHHPNPDFRSANGSTFTYVVELPLSMQNERKCGTCSTDEVPVVHTNKAIHLRLDGNGDVVVSDAVFASLKTAFLGGMQVKNEVKEPPTVYIGAVPKDKEQIVSVPLNRDNTRAPFISPARTKYENEDRMRIALLNKEEEG